MCSEPQGSLHKEDLKKEGKAAGGLDWNREEEGAIEQGDETGKKKVPQQKF